MKKDYYGLFSYSLVFSTYGEFKKKRYIIKKIFDAFDVKYKVIYRMYVFSRPLLGEKQKERIWEDLTRDYTI